MPEPVNRQIILISRPDPHHSAGNFKLVENPVPTLGQGEVLCKTIYLSLDPYMRIMMTKRKSYTPPVEIGNVMVGGTVGIVVDSKCAEFSNGDYVLGNGGWSEFWIDKPAPVSPGQAPLMKINPDFAPISYYLGIMGMPGLTAYVGLLDTAKPKEGETLVVSAAAGAVGTVAGQIGKIKGLRVVGIAGSDEKCSYVVDELGFDACVNYKTENVLRCLMKHCPDGIDIYFDNVGGEILNTVMRLINIGARIPIIGLISQYDTDNPAPGPNPTALLMNRARMEGMLVLDHYHRVPEFLSDMSGWLRDGKIKCRETIFDGLENAPEKFMGLFDGINIGKLLIRVSDDPTR